ncbi:hypothetical protein LG943_23795 [Streptomonospora sp. S1-112]|uniref:Uncharacterized protein n=1 Tax=Streptomonospora mangrovi TaxID=2883123 RepID=A0A9X3NP70_9ACTN|nr:hypothetical protein [Streptomonospora mangrovi]MDA0567319.1 hypothetical protein [Streptomonospora mangrovi]
MPQHTTSAPPEPAHLRLALEVPRWAWHFTLRRLPLVVGLSLIPAAERFGVALWGEALAPAAHAALEVLAQGARVVLVVLLVRIAVLADERVREHAAAGFGRRVQAFLDHRWPSVLAQTALLLALAAVSTVIPEWLVPLWIPAGAHDLYWAVLLAVKNVTVIAFALVWVVGALRQALVEGGRLLAATPAPPAPPAPAAPEGADADRRGQARPGGATGDGRAARG